MNTSPFGEKKDIFYMQKALEQAQLAGLADEVPIGAVIVDVNEEIIAQGHNKVESTYTQTAHAELLAIQQATQNSKNWRLLNCWLYVTLEPCTMCMGLIRLSRLSGVVFATDSPLFGYRLDNLDEFRLYNVDTPIVEGICKEESVAVLKHFFKEKRK